jgi:hypothetical protein
MDAGHIYIKTPLGIEEVQNRKLALAPRLRTMLIMIDGQKTLQFLRESAVKFGCPDNFIESLEAEGLIARVGGTPAATPTASAKAPAAVASGIPAPVAVADATSAPTQIPQDQYVRFRAAKDFMNNAVVNSLGIKAFFFTLKLERAGTIDDLRALVKPFQEALTKATSAGEADVTTKQLLEYLA